MEGDTVDRPIKFAKPKYLDVQKTYEELDPIRNKTIIMPTKQSNKIRTTEPVFQKPIILGENASISQVFNANELENQDIFVHYSAIDCEGYKTLKEGDIVEFNLITTAKGHQAINVKEVKLTTV